MTTEAQKDKAALFAVYIKKYEWKEVHLFEAIEEVYRQNTEAAADGWTIHEKLVAELYAATAEVWARHSGEYSDVFPWHVDAVVEAYETLRKSPKAGTGLDKLDKLNPARLMSLLVLCVLRTFVENVNADKAGQTLWESSKARSDAWARNSVLRGTLVRRVVNHWATITGQPDYAFPWNATAVGRTYLVIRKTKKELDADIDKRRMQLEMFYIKKFKAAREALINRRTAARKAADGG
jgi:hypothetical protein